MGSASVAQTPSSEREKNRFQAGPLARQVLEPMTPFRQPLENSGGISRPIPHTNPDGSTAQFRRFHPRQLPEILHAQAVPGAIPEFHGQQVSYGSDSIQTPQGVV